MVVGRLPFLLGETVTFQGRLLLNFGRVGWFTSFTIILVYRGLPSSKRSFTIFKMVVDFQGNEYMKYTHTQVRNPV